MKDAHSQKDFSYYKKDDLEIRVDFVRPGTPVEYQVGSAQWEESCFQSADVNNLNVEQVWEEVNEWLGESEDSFCVECGMWWSQTTPLTRCAECTNPDAKK